MSDEITNEFQAKMKSVAMGFLNARKVGGDLTITTMFALLSILKSKNKVTDKDLDIIFEVEKESISDMLNEYFSYTHGDRNARIQNEEELKIISRFAFMEIDNYKKQITEAANNIKPERKPKQSELRHVTEGKSLKKKQITKVINNIKPKRKPRKLNYAIEVESLKRAKEDVQKKKKKSSKATKRYNLHALSA